MTVPYFNHFSNDFPRVIIGDNLASDLSADVTEVCGKNKICMLFSPPNSTHLLQPIDLALYGDMKASWWKVLTKWKQADGKFFTTLPKTLSKDNFSLLESMENEADYAISGFRITAIHPIKQHKVLNELTKASVTTSAQYLVSPLLIENLR